MKEYIVKSPVIDYNKNIIFAYIGDHIVFLPDGKTLVNNSGDKQRTYTVNSKMVEGMVKSGIIALTFDTKSDKAFDVEIEEKPDMVNHPPHYTWLKDKCGIEVIDITRHFNNNLGNVLKYVLRHGHKFEQGMSTKEKAVQDLEKAMFYLKDEINKLKNV